MFGKFFGKKKKRELKSGTIEKDISYIMAVPKNAEEIEEPEVYIERLKNSTLFNLIGVKVEKNIIVQIEYKEEIYDIELIPEEFEMSEMFIINHNFTEENYDAMLKADFGLTAAMKFKKSNIDSYHLQLKVLYSMLPDMIGLVDFSTEKIISSVWLKLAVESDIPPSPDYLYSVQAISDDYETVWLHTHGLNRCGSIEFEILNSNKNTYKNHFSILQTIAKRVISNGRIADEEEAFLIGYLNNRQPVIGTWISWTLATTFYDNNIVGSMKDRIGEFNEHNKDTGVIYLYLSPKDCDNKKFHHVSCIDKYLSDNPIVMITTEETIRMSKLAKERLNYFKEAIKNPDIRGIMKFGLLVDEEYREKDRVTTGEEREHIWFEVEEIDDPKIIKGLLAQEPYYISNLTVNSEVQLNLDDLTDWILYTPNGEITPDSVYLLEQ
ncbi:DUF4026 domain-containing protein [Clostridium weizhouense]|uniref:DUF4026 domain-containing protein n=1 Tax=Clostridium weizhouense TaxID=2859781 RepID=A0ABS7ANS3_9CLOT|nr:DUF4026 domain-containing protein [Clostridium weizhouense]MBW6410277.1 DUF4026 domain-containing protein [Clostridium weizhouense]